MEPLRGAARTGRVEFAGLLMIAKGWEDVSDELPDEAPFTLAREFGNGVIQFTVARYHKGKQPNVSIDDLQKLFDEFCKIRHLDITSSPLPDSKVLAIGGISIGDELVGAWYLTDGASIALITYAGPNAG